MITGEGEIKYNNGKLEVSYHWDAAIPYQYPDQTDGGEGILYQYV